MVIEPSVPPQVVGFVLAKVITRSSQQVVYAAVKGKSQSTGEPINSVNVAVNVTSKLSTVHSPGANCQLDLLGANTDPTAGESPPLSSSSIFGKRYTSTTLVWS